MNFLHLIMNILKNPPANIIFTRQLTCLLGNAYAGQEATVRTTDWFQVRKGVHQGCILSPCLFNFFYCKMQGWRKHELESRLPGEISATSDMRMTPPLWQKVKRTFLMKVKEENEKAGLKLNIQKTKIMTSGPNISWQIDEVTVTVTVMSNSSGPHGLHSPWNSPGQNTGVGSLSLPQGIFPTQGSNPGLLHCRQILYQLSHKGTMETVRDFIFLGSKITADGDCSHEIKRHLLLGRKAMTNLYSMLKSRDITLPTKVLVKAMVFPVVM